MAEGARLVKKEVKGKEQGMLAVVTEVTEVLPATDTALPYGWFPHLLDGPHRRAPLNPPPSY